MDNPMSSPHQHNSSTNLSIAFFLNLAFAIVELFGGFLTNSVAILSDALHDFGDSVSLGVAWYLQKVSSRGRDSHFSYGYRRFSLLGALFISVVLFVGSLFVIREGVERLFSPVEANAKGMFLFAILGVAVNGFAAFRLAKGSSLNEKAVSLHLLEDVLGWLAVLVVSVVMMFVHLPILDPLLSIGISVWVLINVFRNLISTFKVLLQEVPGDVDMKVLTNKIKAIEGVDNLHDIHLWTLDGESHILTLHIVSPVCDTKIHQRIKDEIMAICIEYKIDHVTVEIEDEAADCGLNNC